MTNLSSLELSNRALTLCARHGVFTLEDLSGLEEYDVKHWRGAGKLIFKELKDCLIKSGLDFSF